MVTQNENTKHETQIEQKMCHTTFGVVDQGLRLAAWMFIVFMVSNALALLTRSTFLNC